MTDDEHRAAVEAFVAENGVTVCEPGDNHDFRLYRHEQARRQSNARIQNRARRARGPKQVWHNPVSERPSWRRERLMKTEAEKKGNIDR